MAEECYFSVKELCVWGACTCSCSSHPVESLAPRSALQHHQLGHIKKRKAEEGIHYLHEEDREGSEISGGERGWKREANLMDAIIFSGVKYRHCNPLVARRTPVSCSPAVPAIADFFSTTPKPCSLILISIPVWLFPCYSSLTTQPFFLHHFSTRSHRKT